MEEFMGTDFFKERFNNAGFVSVHNKVKDLSLTDAKEKLKEVMDKMVKKRLLNETQQESINKEMDKMDDSGMDELQISLAEFLFLDKIHDEYLNSIGGGGKRRKREKKRKSKRRSKKSKRHSKRK